MIEAVIKSSVVLLIGLGVLPLMRRQSAAVRHAVLTFSLFFGVVVPIVSPLFPEQPGVREIRGQVGNYPININEVLSVNWVITDLSPNFPPRRNGPSTETILFGVWVAGAAVA